jgi:hypoxanthine phosphoribosyltransferase
VSASGPRVLISEPQIRTRVAELGAQISHDYRDKGELVLVGILKGSFIFMADLSRALAIPRMVDFLSISSYGKRGSKAGALRLILDLREPIRNRHVLVVEDIVDTGHTLSYLLEMLGARHPASIKTCALVTKPSRREREVPVEYIGFEIPDEWVVGYGLDYKDRHRTLPYIGVITPDE